jgi:TolB-like protein/class 3 adenylate cyclase/Flp pilus assembly protein TadD
MPQEQRKLAAIMVADVAGYSRLTGLDETDTHRRLMALRAEVLEPLIGGHGGRLVSYTGDGSLAEFPSLVRAVECALAIQCATAEREPGAAPDRRMALRIGLHFGDVIASGADIYGDGVNVAVRLEQIAEPGGICFSNRVHDEIVGRIQFDCEYGGKAPLKNIARPVDIWFWPTSNRGGRAPRILPPPDKPSVGVMPFDEFGARSEDDGLADGMAEDLTTALARLNWLFVVSRTSAFALKGLKIDSAEAGRRLGVRYLLEGSIRRAGERVRIHGQLVDARSGVHIWADHFDGQLGNLLDLQDEIVSSIVGAIEPSLLRAEAERARSARPEDMRSHHYYLRAIGLMAAAFTDPAGGALDEARLLLAKAVELDPGYAPALALAGYFEAKAYMFGRIADAESGKKHALDLVERAVRADPDEPFALGAYGFVSANAGGDLDRAASYIDRALNLNANSPLLWNFAGEIRMYIGDHDSAIQCLHRSMRLNPLDQRTVTNASYLAFAHMFSREPEEAVRWAQRAVIIAPNPLSYRILAASLADGGRIDEARTATAKLLKMQPNACLRRSRGANYRRPEDLLLYVKSLCKAGLPEEPTGELAERPPGLFH